MNHNILKYILLYIGKLISFFYKSDEFKAFVCTDPILSKNAETHLKIAKGIIIFIIYKFTNRVAQNCKQNSWVIRTRSLEVIEITNDFNLKIFEIIFI